MKKVCRFHPNEKIRTVYFTELLILCAEKDCFNGIAEVYWHGELHPEKLIGND